MFDTMTLTKTAAALCGALLVFMLGGWVSQIIYGSYGGHKDDHEQAYVIEVEDAGGAEEVEEEVDFATLYAAAEIDKGERVFSKCSACHKLEAGQNAVGPYLYGVVGREVDAADGFSYSGALEQVVQVWTPEELYAFLENPRGYAPGTSMAFNGLNKSADRINVIAYLDQTDGDMTEIAAAAVPAEPAEATVAVEGEAVTLEDAEMAEAEETAAEASTEDSMTEETAAEEAAADEASTGETMAEETMAEEAAAEEAVTEDAAAEETASEEAATEEVATEEVATEEAATEEAATAEVATEESATEEAATEEATSEETGTEVAMATEATTDEPAAEEAVAQEASGFAALVAAADVSAGERVFNQCKACHVLEAGVNRVGPYLHGVVNRDIGAAEGFRYSNAFGDLEGAWTYDELNAFLENPREYAPGNRMSYRGLRDEEDRAAVIAYIESVSQ